MPEELDTAALMEMSLEDLEELTTNRVSAFVSRLAQKKDFEEQSDLPTPPPMPIDPSKPVGETMAPEGMVAGTQDVEGRLPEAIPENVDQSMADRRLDAARAAAEWRRSRLQGGLA